MSKTITVGIADLHVVKPPDVLVTYALGSCVGICLLDAVAHVGGLAHIMLPDSSLISESHLQPHKFADTGIAELVRQMEFQGARRTRMRAKIAGGAQMFAAMSNSAIANIGNRNITAVKNVLGQLHIPIAVEDVGKDYGRTLYFYPEDGRMVIKSGTKGEWVW